ncbi:MAG: alanine racemase [Candidatus Harrisonbacteria bacterium CG10_big_fil_rev_8_21_14_0_10_40_38]|uniref:Alanine racemase n=1 Tax=Candidatus Harrisonbacteria bacterium CG10_big_fil_rev_8_21_14_0_10_40_38 TaxID=1974583 RepID=A0A2H0USG6_9BACT|nr:MAG: alanine racemase [Candidatus Harrisonbacteria bacterium CG10_big_fil_rev_8_21_14_0_10_40_38]
MKKNKTWIEIKKSALENNIKQFRKLIPNKTQLWSVVKSNAYGHGLTTFAKLAEDAGVDGFCVDSVVEGAKLRETGIKKPILVLGPTVAPNGFLIEAAANDITVTVSTEEGLVQIEQAKAKPKFHIKVDTGMHRQGFYPNDLLKILKKIKSPIRDSFTGLYTHFASAKDISYPTYTDGQFKKFKEAIKHCESAGFKNLTYHSAATGGTLVNTKYTEDVVRIGIGLYGLWPSGELETQLSDKISLKPVLSWRAIISEIKEVEKGHYIGYDLTERATKKTKLAVIPIGYWHGFDRSLSGIGNVLIAGKRAKVMGRVSMDLIVVDVSGITCKVGDTATLIGSSGSDEIPAGEMARFANTTHYETITRINPLIERIVV